MKYMHLLLRITFTCLLEKISFIRNSDLIYSSTIVVVILGRMILK